MFCTAHRLLRITLWPQRQRRFLSHEGPFCGQKGFNISTRFKRCFSWNWPQSLRAKWSFEAKIVPLLSFCDETRTVPPFLIRVVYSLEPHKKYILKRKNLDSGSCKFLDKNDVKLHIRAIEKKEIMFKLSISLQFFKSNNLKSSYWKIIAQTNKQVLCFGKIHFICYMNNRVAILTVVELSNT